MKIVEGTARNMGIAVEGVNDKELEEEAQEAAAEAMAETEVNAETEVVADENNEE